MLNSQEIPSGWELKTLGDVVDFTGGSQPAKSAFSNTFKPGYIRLIQIRDYKTDNFKVFVPKDKVRRFCNKTDVMIGRYGPPLFQILRGLEGAYNVALMKAEPKNGLDKNFLFWFLQNSQIQNYIINLSQRAAGQTGVNKPALHKYPICFPSIEEQKRIVAKIGTLFEKIDRAIKLLEEDIRACDDLMKSALNEVFEGAEEKGWEKHKFKNIAKFIDYRGRTPEKVEAGVKLITAKNVKWGFIADEPAEYIDSTKYSEYMTRGIPNKGDILFTTEAPLGNVAQIESDKKIALAQRLITFQPLNQKYVSRFLMYYLMSDFFRNELFEKSTGSTVKGIKSKILKEIIIYLPKIAIQEPIISFLNSISNKQKELKSKIAKRLEHLKALKASILDSAFRGAL